jgi:hypothetical protein
MHYLSLAFKNTILAVLIIFIIHFMIKNYLADHRSAIVADLPPPPTKPEDEPFEATQPVSIPQTQSEFVKHQTSVQVESKDTLQVKEDDILYQYVFKDKDNKQNTGTVETKTPINVDNKDEAVIELNDALLINKYENENSINGGKLFGDLMGFDLMANNYSNFSPLL